MTIRYEIRYGQAGYDIRLPNDVRERKSFPEALRTETARKRYAEKREQDLLRNGKPEIVRTAPTFEDFGARWMKDYVRAEGLKPATEDAYDRILRLHLYPPIGRVRLDSINAVHVQKVKLHVAGKSEKTRACALSLLANVLGSAEEWGVIARAPRIDLPKYMRPTMAFYDFAEWEQLIAGARAAGPMQLAALLLAGDAGLRRGETVAFEQGDADALAITVQRSEWKKKEKTYIGKPKGGKTRRVPMTDRLKAAIAAVRHLRGKRLLWQAGGRKVQVTTLQSWLEVSCKRAGLPPSRNLHKLRHTFCSHLAMRGVPARQIQEWAGHADLATTQRYMHLSPTGLDSMIKLLEAPAPAGNAVQRGDSGGTAGF